VDFSNIGYLILALLILGAVILAHELGHFLIGRRMDIAIREFAIGFGPKLFKWERRGTKFSIRAFPIGGFVAYAGEDANDERPDAFNNRPVWRRFMAIIAGPAMNFLLAFVLLLGFIVYMGVSVPTSLMVDSVTDGAPAAYAGLMPGDTISGIDGEPLEFGASANPLAERLSMMQPGERLSLDVIREGQPLAIEVSPQPNENGELRIGVGIGLRFETRRLPAGSVLPYTLAYMGGVVKEMLGFLRDLVFRGQGAGDVMGIVGTTDTIIHVAREGFHYIVQLVVLLSMNLGLMNLLPLPALDGGRLVLLVVEGIRRKPNNRNLEAMVHGIGLVALLILIGIVTYQDILRLIVRG